MKSKKTKIKIKEICLLQKEELGLPSKIILKESGEGLNYCRKIKIKNNGGLWTVPDETRLIVKLYDSNNKLGKAEVIVTLRDGSKVEMSFLDLCNLRDILSHTRDLGLNLFNDTEIE